MPSWGPLVISLQLVFTWFAPPIGVGTRSVFLGDVWLLLWTVSGLLDLAKKPDLAGRNARFFKSLMGWGLLFSIVMIHGVVRPDLKIYSQGTPYVWLQNPPFSILHEGVVAGRFLSWIAAGLLVNRWMSELNGEQPKYVRKVLGRTFFWSVCLASLALILSTVSLRIANGLGSIYGYDLSASPWWKGRAYGVFRSPIEAAITIGLCPALYITLAGITPKLRFIGIGLSAIGLLLTQTLTPIIGWLTSGLAMIGSRLKPRQFRIFLASGVLVGSAICWLASTSTHPVIQQKLGDFLYRFGPWRVLWNVVKLRVDCVVLGLGFSSYHIDNIYIFLLDRGGLVLFGAVLIYLFHAIKRNWEGWNWSQRTCVIYVLVSGLALDSFIMRPLVALWLTIAIPALVLSKEVRNDRLSSD